MDENDEEQFFYQIYEYIFQQHIQQNKVIPLDFLLKYQDIKNSIENLKKEIQQKSPHSAEIYSITESITSPYQQEIQISAQSGVSGQNAVGSISSNRQRTSVLTTQTIGSSICFSSPHKVIKVQNSRQCLLSEDEWNCSPVHVQFSPDGRSPMSKYLKFQNLNSQKESQNCIVSKLNEPSNLITVSESNGKAAIKNSQKNVSPELTFNDLNISKQPSFVIGQAVVRNETDDKTQPVVVFNVETPPKENNREENVRKIRVQQLKLRNPRIIKEAPGKAKIFKKQNYAIYTYQQLVLALNKIGITYTNREEAIAALEKAELENPSSPIKLTQYEMVPEAVRIDRETEIKRMIMVNNSWYKQIIQHVPINSKELFYYLKTGGIKGVSQGFLDQYLLRQGVITVYNHGAANIVKEKRKKGMRQLTLSQMRLLGKK